ncbi:MAG: thiol peroxidase [Cyclobacteriaceae bacterium]
MAQTKLGETLVNTNGELPHVGDLAPVFKLTGNDLKEVDSSTFKGKNLILNIFPSIDTRVCATSVREFNKRAAGLANTVVLCISKDLPFAHKRFCGAEGIENVVTLSDFRSKTFTRDYGVEMVDGGMSGLMARVVFVIDPEGKIRHSELVPAIGLEPDYEAALRAVQ